MSQLTGNTTAFVEAEQYSQFILDNMHDYLLPAGMYRDVSDFGSGTTLNIKTVGTVENIKYNTSIKYSTNHINKYPIPINIDIELVVDLDFTESDVDMLKTRLVSELKEAIITEGIRKYKISEIISKTSDKVKVINIVSPEVDIIYDYDEKQYLNDIYVYTPELLILNESQINITYGVLGQVEI